MATTVFRSNGKDNEKELEGMPEALKVQKVKEAYKIFKESKKLKASSKETPI